MWKTIRYTDWPYVLKWTLIELARCRWRGHRWENHYSEDRTVLVWRICSRCDRVEVDSS